MTPAEEDATLDRINCDLTEAHATHRPLVRAKVLRDLRWFVRRLREHRARRDAPIAEPDAWLWLGDEVPNMHHWHWNAGSSCWVHYTGAFIHRGNIVVVGDGPEPAPLTAKSVIKSCTTAFWKESDQ